MTPSARVEAAIQTITSWMEAHGGEAIVASLYAGATDARLAAVEDAIGHPLPDDLRALWALHDGQRAGNGGFFLDRAGVFYAGFPFLGCEDALAAREDLLYPVHAYRSLTTRRPEEPREDEAATDAWIPISDAREKGCVMVCATSGRVFVGAGDDGGGLELDAPSVGAWLERYAANLTSGRWVIRRGRLVDPKERGR